MNSSLKNRLVQNETTSLRQKLAGLEKENRILVEEIQRLRKPPKGYRIRMGKIRSGPGDFVRVAIPDSHGSKICPKAAAAFLADLKQLDPREIIMGGDHVDCGGFLAQHHTLGYVAETEYSYADDCDAANAFLDQIMENARGATIDYLEGNHEARVTKWAVTAALRHGRDAEMLRQAFAPEFKLHLKERGIKYYRLSEKYDDLPVPGAIKKGKCGFWHSTSTAKDAAAVNLRQFGGNVVFFHTHRADSATACPVAIGPIAAWNPGCLCIQQMLWCHGRPTNWTQGYGVQLVARSGAFLHINVPIIDGQSLLMSLLKK
ncbi:MAG: hypothetical protein SFV32_12695 [Opitutaceae bacterium]|nr:hypothetical protein [Opitutaceae bacterium]